jgi:type IV secretion system protein VirB8
MDEQDRIENPLGFQVSSYRVDNDYAAAPPLQAQVSGAPSIMQTAASTLPPDTAMPLQSSGSVAR